MKKLLVLLAILTLTATAYAAVTTVTVSFSIDVDSDDVKLAKVGLVKIGSNETIKDYCTRLGQQAAQNAFDRMVEIGKRVEQEKPAKAAAIKATLVDGLE